MDALLLDYNGVIVDDEPLHLEAIRGVLAEVGIAISEAEYYRHYLGFDDRTCIREIYTRANRTLATELERALLARKAERYGELASSGLPVVEGAADFVRAAAERFRLAVVSGALRAEIDSGLEAAGVRRLVDEIVSIEDSGAPKPDPAGFRAALRKLANRHGEQAWRACVIEDSATGLAAARALGAGCLMLTTSYGAADLPGADLVWESFAGHDCAELMPLLRRVKA